MWCQLRLDDVAKDILNVLLSMPAQIPYKSTVLRKVDEDLFVYLAVTELLVSILICVPLISARVSDKGLRRPGRGEGHS